jgi:hypothetical protein
MRSLTPCAFHASSARNVVSIQMRGLCDPESWVSLGFSTVHASTFDLSLWVNGQVSARA